MLNIQNEIMYEKVAKNVHKNTATNSVKDEGSIFHLYGCIYFYYQL